MYPARSTTIPEIPYSFGLCALRCIKKYGYTYLTTYYLMNWATMFFLNRTLAYPKVR